MTPDEKTYGHCRSCGREFRLTARGGVWPHDDRRDFRKVTCTGSNQDPYEHAAAVDTYEKQTGGTE